MARHYVGYLDMSNITGEDPSVSQRSEREEMTLTFVTEEDISPRIPVFAGVMDDGRFGPRKLRPRFPGRDQNLPAVRTKERMGA